MEQTENEKEPPAKVNSLDETFVFLLVFWVLACLVLVALAFSIPLP